MSLITTPSNSHSPSLRRGHAMRRGCAAYIQVVWLEYLCISVVAAFTLGLYCTPTHYKDYRVVPMLPSITPSGVSQPFGQFQLPLEISYPLVGEPLPTRGCAVVVVLVPLLVIGMFQIKTWSLWDFHAGVVGLLKAVVSTSFVCTTLKHFIGGFRPFYIEACKPDWDAIVEGIHQKIYRFNATLCLGNPSDIDRALQAFPSGHASSSFAAAVFLSLYLNAKLKVFSDHASHFWAFMVVLTPLILASLVSGSMLTSHQHQAQDLIFGMIIGLILGMLAYRSAYAAVFDFRLNHIPLLPFAIKTQYSQDADCLQDAQARLKGEQGAEDDELVFWSWWKQAGAKIEEKEEGMPWLQSIKSVRMAGQEPVSKPRMRKCSPEPIVLKA